MSFRSRMILFFALIVLVPVAVIAVGLTHLADESSGARTDATLNAGAETALALYAQDLQTASDRARVAGRDEALARALRAGDPPAAQRAADRLAEDLDLAGLSAHDNSGRRLAATGDPALAPAEVGVQGPGGELGTVSVQTLRPERYVSRVSSLTGDQVVLLAEGGVLAGTVDVAPGDLPAGEGESDLDLPDGESSALTVAPEGAPAGVRVTIVTPRESSGLGTSPPALIAAALAFLALGLVFVVLLVRALGSQVREMLSAARRIGGGDFSQRVPVTGDDELAGLAREFNTMSGRLSRQMDELRSQGTELERSLRRTGEAFAAAGDRSSLLQVAADAALPACRAEAARAIMTGEPVLQAVAGGPPSASLAEALREVEDLVLRDRVPADAGIAEAFAFAEPVPGARGTRGRRAVMAVARSGSPFESSERQALRHLAGQVAVALENVELHELIADEAVAAR